MVELERRKAGLKHCSVCDATAKVEVFGPASICGPLLNNCSAAIARLYRAGVPYAEAAVKHKESLSKQTKLFSK